MPTSLPRELTRPVMVGSVQIGGGAPVVVQSMTCTPTSDTEATLNQIRALADGGCDVVRVTLPNRAAIDSFKVICDASPVPIIADIHFDYRLAIAAVDAGADKIRINPGNIGGEDRVKAVVACCRAHKAPHPHRRERRLAGKGAARKVRPRDAGGARGERAGPFALLHDDFTDICSLSKAPSCRSTWRPTGCCMNEWFYPLHLGVTEAGTPSWAVLKSAVGIGGLLCEGIGDTMRVSLTADPVEEVYAAKRILRASGCGAGVNLISCPTCGRTAYDIIPLAEELERRLEDCDKPITVAVMGCVVNGPGEASAADIGVAGGKGEGPALQAWKTGAQDSREPDC